MVGCAKEYDDTELKSKVDELSKEVSKLSQDVKDLNSQVVGFKEVIDQWKAGGYVESVQPVKEGDKEVGQTITFLGGKTVTIYYGKDGKDGDKGDKGDKGDQGDPGTPGTNGKTPEITIGTIAGAEGLYWLVDGEALKVDGKPVPATVLPVFSINAEGHLIVTINGEEQDLGLVKGAGGDSMFKSVEVTETGVTFTPATGDPFTIPFAKAFKLVINNLEAEVEAGKAVEFPYEIQNANATTTVDVFAGGNYAATVNEAEKKIVVTPPTPAENGSVLAWAQNEEGLFSMKKLSFIVKAETEVKTTQEELEAIPGEAGDFVVNVVSNIDIDVETPTVDWVSVAVTKADYKLTLTLAENTTDAPRETEIIVVRKDNRAQVQKIKIVQLVVDNTPMPDANPGDILWSEDWTVEKDGIMLDDYTFTGTKVFNDYKVKYSAVKPEGGSDIKVYLDTQMGGAAQGNLLLSKKGGTWTISGIPSGNATQAVLTFTTNAKDRLDGVTSDTEGVTMGEMVAPTEKSKPYSYAYDITLAAGVTKFNLTFTCNNDSNVRLDDIVLKVPEAVEKEVAIERLWGYYPNSGWPTSFVPANADRGVATDGENVYVTNTTDGTVVGIKITDQSKVTVNMTGVDGGFFKTCSAKTIYNPSTGKYILLVGSLANASDCNFNVYAWKDGIDQAPTKIISWNTNNGSPRRIGDFFTVSGDWSNGEIWARINQAEPAAATTFVWKITDGVAGGVLGGGIGYAGSAGMGSVYKYSLDAPQVMVVTPDIAKFYTCKVESTWINANSDGIEWTDGSDVSAYAKRFGYTPFEFNGKKYIAYLHMVNAARGWLTVLNDTQGTAEGFMKTIIDNDIFFQGAVQINKDEASTDVVAGATYSGNTMANCSVAVLKDEVIIVGHQQNTGLAVFKMYLK